MKFHREKTDCSSRLPLDLIFLQCPASYCAFKLFYMEGDWGHNSIMLTGNSNAILCSFIYLYYMLCHFIQ